MVWFIIMFQMPIFELKGKLSSTPKLFYREKNLEVWSYELLDLTPDF